MGKAAKQATASNTRLTAKRLIEDLLFSE